VGRSAAAIGDRLPTHTRPRRGPDDASLASIFSLVEKLLMQTMPRPNLPRSSSIAATDEKPNQGNGVP
jgi:hypothetical protein